MKKDATKSNIAITRIIITVFFEDEIGEKLIGAVNQQLKTSIEVEDFNLSIFVAFIYCQQYR